MKSDAALRSERIRISKLIEENKAEFDNAVDEAYLGTLAQTDSYLAGYTNALRWMGEADRDVTGEDLLSGEMEKKKGRTNTKKL